MKNKTREEVFFKRHHPELYLSELAVAKARQAREDAERKEKRKPGAAMHLENDIVKKCFYNQSSEFIADLRVRRDAEHQALLDQYNDDEAARLAAHPTPEHMARYDMVIYVSITILILD
jgi:hypothetical protein